jgi:NADPH-dependent curcumin reductase CurA
VGKPLSGLGIGRIYDSKDPHYRKGEVVTGSLEWAEFTYLPKSFPVKPRVLENKHKLPWSAFLGVLGMPGFTAYW